jgi:hypothetical protein
MKKIIFLLLLTALISPLPIKAQAETKQTLAERLSGKILLQVESYGRAWYIYPKTKERYYLKDGYTAYQIMRSLSLGISNKDLSKIPTNKEQTGDKALVERLKGMILLQVEENGEAWYVNPTDGIRYYLKDGEVAYSMMRNFALGINNGNLKEIAMNKTQLVHDTTFNDLAYVKLNSNNSFSNGYNADTILPLASLTKLMTALVFLDTNPNWQKTITITAEHINYPASYVGDDTTSEVPIKLGDQITLYDLWVAMLVASSNQAAAALADSTGMEFNEFVDAMNKKATQLGLTKTIFYDVAGLDSHNVTTAKEMALIAKAAFDKPEIANASAITNHTAKALLGSSSRDIKIANRNASLLAFSPEASKTGFLVEAQRTVALKKNGSIIVVMHALSMAQRNNAITTLLK